MLGISLIALGISNWTYDGSHRIQSVIDDILKRSREQNITVHLQDRIPNETYELNIRANDFGELMTQLSSKTPIRSYSIDPRVWYVSWSKSAPGKGQVRLFQDAQSHTLAVTEVSVKQIRDRVKLLMGQDITSRLQREGVTLETIVKEFSTPDRKPEEPPVETVEAFLKRLTESLVKHLAAKPAAKPPAKLERAAWVLTFLQADPPGLGGAVNVNFGAFQEPVAALAKALTDAYAPSGPPPAGATIHKPEVTVRPAGRSLIIEGSPERVDEVRRLLATQIDVPQGQILIEMDAYQVSAQLSGQRDADRSVRKLILSQEIARAYKKAHLDAIKVTISKLNGSIQLEFMLHRLFTGTDMVGLMKLAGMESSSNRVLGQSEVLLFAAYCQRERLQRAFNEELGKRFSATEKLVDSSLIKPLADAEPALAKELCELNAALGRTPHATDTRQLVHIAGELGDHSTRMAIEDFLTLWVSCANTKIADNLLRAESDGERSGSSPFDGFSYSPPGRPEQQTPVFGSPFLVFPVVGIQPSRYRLHNKERVRNLLEGDRAMALTRAANALDGLLQRGIEMLREDSNSLVDLPLQLWIDKHVIGPSSVTRFGVRFGGTTTLIATSRVPGVTGAQAESFFPYQPVAPLDMQSILPLISRDRGKDASEVAGGISSDAIKGMTALEALILRGLFSQAEQLPYQRKLATGLHLSVLPTMLPSGSTARLQVRLSLSTTPDEANNGGGGSRDKPGPVDLLKSTVVETELLANAFDITHVSSLKMDVSAPAKRDWEFPVLSQILPIRSIFVGPTRDRTVRHEAIVLMRITIIPKAMDLASRYLGGFKG